MTPEDGQTSGKINVHFYNDGIINVKGFDFDDTL